MGEGCDRVMEMKCWIRGIYLCFVRDAELNGRVDKVYITFQERILVMENRARNGDTDLEDLVG